jgi:hypothetical protein
MILQRYNLVGDVHGHADPFGRCHHQIETDRLARSNTKGHGGEMVLNMRATLA